MLLKSKFKNLHLQLKCNATWLILEMQCEMLFTSFGKLFNSIGKIRSTIVPYMVSCVVDGKTLSS